MPKSLNYFSIILFILVFYLSFLLIRPFLGSILSALVISYLIYPFFQKIKKSLRDEDLSIFVTIFILVIIILAPLFLVAYSLLDDLQNFIIFLKNFDSGSLEYKEPWVTTLLEKWMLPILEDITSNSFGILGNFLKSLPNKFLSIVVFLFSVFLFLKEGPGLIKKFKVTIPLDYGEKEVLFKEFQIVSRSVIYSAFISSLLNGILTILVFWIFGIPNQILWGFVSFILSFVPIISNSPVWIGGGLYLLLKNIPIINILLFALFGALTNQLTNLIAIKVAGKYSRINSLLVLIGMIGGIRTFGLVGIIFGPLVLSILITLIKVYTKDFKSSLNINPG